MEYFKNWGEVIKNLRQAKPKRMVLAAGGDEHALEAVSKVVADGLLEPILVGDKSLILNLGQKLALKVSPDNIYDVADHEKAATLAVSLVAQGQGDFLMKGALETATLLKAVVNKDSGLASGQLMSHVAMIELPSYHKMLAITDGGMVPYPDLEAKKAIINNAVSL
ncbi:MAG: phosphate acyltransferase, partial [Candidatus Adiutrix sp.]